MSNQDGGDRVIGVEKLTTVFGYWPSFHDSEVIWFHLDRRPDGEGQGPTVEAMIRAFEITSEVGPGGFLVLRHHVLVHFRFREAVELELDGFNCQNALFGLTIADIRDRQLERIHFQVRFDSSFGLGVSFQCREVEVLSVEPCDQDGVLVNA